MKTYLKPMLIGILSLFFVSVQSFGQTVIWEETFAGQTGYGIDGTVTNMGAVTNWTVDVHPAFPTNGHFMVVSNTQTHEVYFQGRRLSDECVWQSESIDISTHSPVDVTLQLQERGDLASGDSIGIYYLLNGTNEVQFAENGFINDDFTFDNTWLTASQEYLSGTSLTIVVKMNNSVTVDAKDYRIDNICVSETSIMSNSPPEISVENDETNRFAMVGEPIQFLLTATENVLDAGSDTITVWADGLPVNAIFTTTNGLSPLSQTFLWTPTSPDTVPVRFFASDKDGTNQLDVTITVSQLDPGKVWINEIHYDNDGTDEDEGIEIAGPAGYSLNAYKVYFYNGADGGILSTLDLSGTIDNEGEGFGARWFNKSNIQNDMDGMALVREVGAETNVLQFLSYEGDFVAIEGPASGLTSVDIGVDQPASTPVGETLQLTGRGKVYSEFSWTGPVEHSRGSLNAGQTIVRPGFVLIVR